MNNTQQDNDYSELYGFKEDNNAMASPAAQTFMAPYSAYLSSVNLYFRAGQSTDYGITMEIRDTINGLPGDKYYSRQALRSNQINVDPSGNTPTTFRFDNPVFLKGGKQYAIVLYTASTNYQLAVSVIGQYSQNASANVTTEGINSNQEVHGTFCYSMDGKTWNTGDPTSHMQDAANGTLCLKFDVNTAEFDTNNNTVKFSPNNDLGSFHYSARNTSTTMNNMSYFTFMPSVFTPNNTSVNWRYALNSDDINDSKKLTNNSTVALPNEDLSNINIWAELNGSQNVSPVINTGSMDLTVQTTKTDRDNKKTPDESLGLVDESDPAKHSVNPFSKQDDAVNAGEYISRNLDFKREDESQDPQFTDIFASYEFQSDGAPRPSLYFNLNANGDPNNNFKSMWIQMPGYDEPKPDKKGAVPTANNDYNGPYAIIDPYDSSNTAIDSTTGTLIDSDIVNRAFGMRSYSQNVTTNMFKPEDNWVRYHFHVSLNRLVHNYFMYYTGDNSNKDIPVNRVVCKNTHKPTNAYEIAFKLILHSGSIYTHPKVRKFRSTMNDSSENDLNEVAPS